MGRLSEKLKFPARRRRKLAGLERRWLVNNVSVMVVLAALCVAAVTLGLGAYYYSNLRSGLEAKAKTTTDFFSNYISQSYNEYYQSCIQFAETFEDKDKLELQFITAGGKMVASSYGEFAGKSPQTPDISEAVSTISLDISASFDAPSSSATESFVGLNFSISEMRFLRNSISSAESFFEFLSASISARVARYRP